MKKFIVSAFLILFMFCGCTAKENTASTTENSTHTTQSEPATEQSSVEESSFYEHTTENNTITAVSDNTQVELSSKESCTTAKNQSVTTKSDDSLITVTVYCSCKNAVDYGIRDKKDYSHIIPANGIMLNSTVTVKKGSSALDAIKEACLISGTEISEKRGYIRGIGGLYEKNCGGASGWMYCVNGTFPNMSSDKYTLESGDRIELHYTVNLGDVN